MLFDLDLEAMVDTVTVGRRITMPRAKSGNGIDRRGIFARWQARGQYVGDVVAAWKYLQMMRQRGHVAGLEWTSNWSADIGE